MQKKSKKEKKGSWIGDIFPTAVLLILKYSYTTFFCMSSVTSLQNINNNKTSVKTDNLRMIKPQQENNLIVETKVAI